MKVSSRPQLSLKTEVSKSLSQRFFLDPLNPWLWNWHRTTPSQVMLIDDRLKDSFMNMYLYPEAVNIQEFSSVGVLMSCLSLSVCLHPNNNIICVLLSHLYRLQEILRILSSFLLTKKRMWRGSREWEKVMRVMIECLMREDEGRKIWIIRGRSWQDYSKAIPCILFAFRFAWARWSDTSTSKITVCCHKELRGREIWRNRENASWNSWCPSMQ